MKAKTTIKGQFSVVASWPLPKLGRSIKQNEKFIK